MLEGDRNYGKKGPVNRMNGAGHGKAGKQAKGREDKEKGVKAMRREVR